MVEIDKQFVEINKNPSQNKKPKVDVKLPEKKTEQKVSKEDVAKTADKIIKMDLWDSYVNFTMLFYDILSLSSI